MTKNSNIPPKNDFAYIFGTDLLSFDSNAPVKFFFMNTIYMLQKTQKILKGVLTFKRGHEFCLLSEIFFSNSSSSSSGDLSRLKKGDEEDIVIKK